MHSSRMSRLRRMAAAVVIAALAGSAASCESITEPLLEAVDPDIINPADVRDADGAEAVRIGALQRLAQMTSAAEGPFFFGGLLADEWKSGDTFQQRDETDQRLVQVTNANLNTAIRDLHRARVQAIQAVGALRAFKPTPVANIGQMFFVKGFAELQAAQDLCNGLVFSDGSGETAVLGTPMSVIEAATLAAATFDSALAHLTATDTFTIRVQRAATVGKARALVYQSKNQLAAAAPLVASVPTDYRYLVTFLQASGDNEIWALNNS